MKVACGRIAERVSQEQPAFQAVDMQGHGVPPLYLGSLRRFYLGNLP